MYEIFVKLLNEKGITPYKLSQDTGISTATLSDWKKGRSTPKQDKLKKIADYFGVSVDFLMTGKEKEGGEDYYVNEETKKIAQAIFGNEDLRKLFEVSQDMTPEQIKAFTAMIDTMITKDKMSRKKD